MFGMMGYMETETTPWDKRSIEIPPGWHKAMRRLSASTGVALKYLYSVALDRLLRDENFEIIEEEASVLQRRARKDLTEVSGSHTPETVEKRARKVVGSQSKRKTKR